MVVRTIVFLVIGAADDTTPLLEPLENPAGHVDKHATQLDLVCDSYNDGVDWPKVKEHLKEFLKEPETNVTESLVSLALSKPKTDCYIGLLSLGYFGLLFMDPDKRLAILTSSLFGSLPFQEQIPLSYWDTIASGWPVFSLFELVSIQVRHDQPEKHMECCDFLAPDPTGNEAKLLDLLMVSLRSQSTVSSTQLLRYLAESPSRCSWGKAASYFALAERYLLTQSAPRLHQAARDTMTLGEFQLDHCFPGRNVSVVEQMYSSWPFWGFLRRIEQNDNAMAALMSQHSRAGELPRMPPSYSPPSLLHREGGPDQDGQVVTSANAAEIGSGASAGLTQLACEARDVHVAIAGDRRHAEGVLAAVHSVVTGTASPWRICVHVFALLKESSFYYSAFKCSFGAHLSTLGGEDGGNYSLTLAGAAVQIHTFEPTELVWAGADHTFAAGTAREAGDLNSPHNFVRFHLARWVPLRVARKLIYLDTDIIVRGDICKLHDTALASCGDFKSTVPTSSPAANKQLATSQCLREPVVAAVPRRHLPISVYLKVLSPKSSRWLPSVAQSFNAGVMVINMAAWARSNITDQVAELVRQNIKGRFWRHGSQPPLLVLLYDRAEWLDEKWNVDGLGHKRDIPETKLSEAHVLHWTGPLKPWVANGLYKSLWKPYAVHCWGDGSRA